MIYWIGINVISNNNGLLNAVERVIPARGDARFWDNDGYISQKGIGIDDNNFFTASLYFNDELERHNFHLMLKGINGMIHAAMSGSFIKISKCYHDELTNGLCTKLDELTFEEVVP